MGQVHRQSPPRVAGSWPLAQRHRPGHGRPRRTGRPGPPGQAPLPRTPRRPGLAALGAEQLTVRDELARAKADTIALPPPNRWPSTANARAGSVAWALLRLGAPRVGRARQPRHPPAGLPGGERYCSFPGLGDRLTARVAGEIGDDIRQFTSPNARQCSAGRAPLTRRCGPSEDVVCRRLACNHFLGEAVHHWAVCSLRTSAGWKSCGTAGTAACPTTKPPIPPTVNAPANATGPWPTPHRDRGQTAEIGLGAAGTLPPAAFGRSAGSTPASGPQPPASRALRVRWGAPPAPLAPSGPGPVRCHRSPRPGENHAVLPPAPHHPAVIDRECLADRATRVPHRAGNPGTERTTTVTCTPRGPR
jgi:Transposase IS116/IS110/IS902 family